VKESAGSLERDKIVQDESGRADLAPQLLRPVEEGAREVLRPVRRVAVLAVDEVPLHNPLEVGVREEHSPEAVEKGGEAGDSGGEEEAARPQDPPGLAESGQALAAPQQVVERPQQQDHIHAGAGLLQSARLSPPHAGQGGRLSRGGPLGLLHVEGHGVNEVDLIPPCGQPERVSPGRAPPVQDHGGGGRQVAGEELPGAGPLEPELLVEPPRLHAPPIEGGDLGWDFHGWGEILTPPQPPAFGPAPRASRPTIHDTTASPARNRTRKRTRGAVWASTPSPTALK
jgi:hypothetical protein